MSTREAPSFETGTVIEILEEGEVIDEALVKSCETHRHKYEAELELEVESLKLNPGAPSVFILLPGKSGWLFLFEDPMTEARSYDNSIRAPVYQMRKKA